MPTIIIRIVCFVSSQPQVEPSQLSVALFDGASEGQRTAGREGGVAGVHGRQHRQSADHGDFGPAEDEGHRPGQQRVAETGAELPRRHCRPAGQGAHERQHRPAQGAAIRRGDAHQFLMVDHRPALHCAQFFPQAMERLAGARTKEVVNATHPHPLAMMGVKSRSRFWRSPCL